MKYVFLSLIFSLNALALNEELSISGKVLSEKACSGKAMVWLSLDKENYKERLLLLHTEVPAGGTFRFYVKSGNYQVRATDEAGCEYLERVSIQGKSSDLTIRLVKK